jgi:CubicO group peptidase (beta-lactamase class C family)
MRPTAPLFLALFLVLVQVGPLAAQPPLEPFPDGDPSGALAALFRGWDSESAPGCAVGVELEGERGAPSAGPTLLLRSWGMAELEHEIPNSPNTVFEAGSVSKQFTAAAIILLELDGVLSLDDDIREWIPELPDYGAPLTLHHLMTHTAGLRDWGVVSAIGGWGRGERTHTHDHVLEIATRQRALNYPPGEAYSYSNTGYNLLAIVVERATGTPFADFSRERIFEPLGLTRTHWRDDYRRLVPGRSGAYQWRGGAWIIDRPIEDVHGNGGLLTTVSDLLRWNRALTAAARGEAEGAALGGPAFHARMVDQAVLNDGTQIPYAGGLFVETLDGRPAITHTGATSGYRAYLGRFPDDGLSVAILCNAGNANPGQLGSGVARLFLQDSKREESASAPPTSESPPPARTSAPALLTPLTDFEGRFESDEAETVWEIVQGSPSNGEAPTLFLVRRPGIRTPLSPLGPDRFQSPVGDIQFHRDASGAITELGLTQPRVWDLRFRKLDP